MSRMIGGRYEIPADDAYMLGRGGMGTVFLATDTRTGQKVAVKQLKADIVLDSPDFVERFNREAEALRRLNHPNIVTVFGTIEEDDQHYLVMEYVSGGSLQDVLDAMPMLSIDRVLEIALDLADALTRAHRLKIVHRDLKPANVLLAEDGTPRLTDFGVAQMGDKSRVTQTGTVVGTLNYLSPEALNGKKLDERADIWAFGVMLYEMLAGRRPFDDESTTSLITSILTKSAPDLSELRPDLPKALADLVHKMLEKDRDLRIDSVRKIGSELEDIIRGADSDELHLDSSLVNALKKQGKTRFGAISTPEGTHLRAASSRHGIATVEDGEGGRYYMIPERKAIGMRIAVGVLLLVLVLAVFYMAGMVRKDKQDEQALATQNAEATQAAVDSAPPMRPVADDEYLILVITQSDAVGMGDATLRPVMQNLMDTLEKDITFSNLRVQSFRPSESSDDDHTPRDGNMSEQMALVEETGAALVVNLYEREGQVTATIRIGSLKAFPYNAFDYNLLDRLVGAEVVFTDTKTESLVPYVLGAMAILQTADGNLFELMRTITMMAEVDMAAPQVISSGISPHLYRYFSNYLTNPQVAVTAMDDALNNDGGNPILYAYRALAKVRLMNMESAAQDMTTAGRIGPEKWTIPLFLVSGPMDVNLRGLDAAIEARPDDWFLYTMRAEYHYMTGNLDAARTDIDLALANDPKINIPHILGFLTAFHQGRIADAGAIMTEVVRKFPDPNFSSRVFDATFGETGAYGGIIYTSVANLLVGQYAKAIADTEVLMSLADAFLDETASMVALDGQPFVSREELSSMTVIASDLFLIRGLASCNMGDMEAASAAYDTGLTILPDYHMLWLLSSEVDWMRGEEALAETDAMNAMGLSDEFDAFVLAAVNDENSKISCATFFDSLGVWSWTESE